MKVLALNKYCPKHPMAGGAEKRLEEVLSRVGEEDEVTLLSAKYPGCRNEEFYRGFTIKRFGFENSYNTVWIHLLFPFIFLFKKWNADLVYEDVSPCPLFSYLFFPFTPRVVVNHHLDRFEAVRSQRFLLGVASLILEWMFLLTYKSENVVVVSLWMKDELESKGFQNVHMIKNGVDSDFEVRKDFSKTPSVLFLGRNEARKGPDLIMPAVEKVLEEKSNLEFWFAGPNTEMMSAVSNKVKLYGWVSEEKKKELLRKAWLVVAPSRLEGYGLTFLEANAAGTFVVANDVKGLRESVKDGKTGVLIDCSDPDVLAEKVLKWLDKRKLKPRVEDCKEWAGEHSWDETARETKELISHVTEAS